MARKSKCDKSAADVGKRRADPRRGTLNRAVRRTYHEIRTMAQHPEPQRPLTDEEHEQVREGLKEFFDEIAEDLAEETGRPVEEFQPDTE